MSEYEEQARTDQIYRSGNRQRKRAMLKAAKIRPDQISLGERVKKLEMVLGPMVQDFWALIQLLEKKGVIEVKSPGGIIRVDGAAEQEARRLGLGVAP